VGRLIDPDRLAAYLDALSNWNLNGYVEFRLTEQAYNWLRRELDGVTLKEFARLMYEYLQGGGEIDEVRETREQWSSEYEFHHDLRFEIQGKRVYVETRLKYRPPFVKDDPAILVVSIHAP
jgi:hypothetical protein